MSPQRCADHGHAIGVTEKEDRKEGIDQQDIFDRVVFFLATITLFLFSRVLGADDAPFGPVMGSGDTGTAVGAVAMGEESSGSGVTIVAASASETPSRCARAVRERVGASPRARRAASSAGGEHESTDWLSPAPCRTGARGPLGGYRSSGR